jgi:hypothetical protein
LLFFIVGCSSHDSIEVQTKKVYYPNGQLRKVQEYSADLKENGIYKYFSENGVLLDSAKITNNEFHGNRYLYFHSGEIKQITTYYRNFYRSGLEFSENGIKLMYRSYDYNKNLKFLVEFDSLGNWKRSEGELIHTFVNKEFFPLGEEFSFEMLVGTPHGFITTVEIGEWNPESKSYFWKKEHSPDMFNRVVYSSKQNPEKDLVFVHIAKVEDYSGQVFLVDSLIAVVSSAGYSSFPESLSEL